MKPIQLKVTLWSLAAWCAATVATAAENHPGYVDFSDLRGLIDSEPVVEVTLREPLLRLITETIPEDDHEAVNFVSRLLSVRLHVYEDIESNTGDVGENVDEIAESLDSEGWERVVRVRDDEDKVDVFLRMSEDEDVVHGIALMVFSDDGEMVLGNIVGDIRFDDISALGRRFDIDELSELQSQTDEEATTDEQAANC